MKNFFQRRHSSEAGPSKSASSQDPYSIWRPRPETEVPQRASGRSEKRDNGSSSRKPTERHRSSSRTPRQNDGDSVSPHAPPSSTYKYSSAPTSKDIYSAGTSTASTSRRAPPQYAQPTPQPNPTKLASNMPSYTTHVNTTSSNSHPSTEGATDPQVHASSAMHGVYATSSAPTPAIWLPPTKAASSSSKRTREREGERSDRYGDRSRQREREREKEKGRDKDGDRVKERERTRDRERERERGRGREEEREREREREKERERERLKRLERETNSFAVSGMDRLREKDQAREKERQRDRVKERDVVRERDYYRDLERRRDTDADLRARERAQHREADRVYRSRRPSDMDRERPPDMDRSSAKPRRPDAERDRDVSREYNSVPRPSGKDSSDEGESSDASKRNHNSSHRRRARETTTSTPWTPSAVMHPPSVPAPPYTSPNIMLVPRHVPEPAAPVQSQYTPQPLPVHLPLKLPDQKPLQDAVQSQDVNGHTTIASSAEIKQSRRMERHAANTHRVPSQDKESGTGTGAPQMTVQQQQAQKAFFKSNESSGRAYGDDRLAKTRPNQVQEASFSGHAASESRERTNSGNNSMQSVGSRAGQSVPPADFLSKSVVTPSASEDPSRLRPEPRAQYPYTTVSHRHDTTISNGFPIPSRTSEQIHPSGTSVIPSVPPRAPRIEAPSTSQQASSSSGHSYNRREREKLAKGNEDQGVSFGKDARNHQGTESAQGRGYTDPTSSLLFHETQMGNSVGQPSVPVPNNSPHASLHTRFTPPTPVKRSPAAEIGQSLNGHSRLNSFSGYTTSSPVVLGRSATAGVPGTNGVSTQSTSMQPASGGSEMPRAGRVDELPTSTHPLQKTSSHERLMVSDTQRPSNKVSQLIAGYEARSSPSIDRAGSVAPSSSELPRKLELDNPSNVTGSNARLEDRYQAPVGSTHAPATLSTTPMQSSPAFNVSLSTNDRGRVISFSASNEDGSPARQASAGSNSGQLPTHSHLPGMSDTPSSKHTVPTPMMNVTNVISDTNQFLGSSWKSHPSTVGTRGKEDILLGSQHPATMPKPISSSGTWSSRNERSTVQNAIPSQAIPSNPSSRRGDSGDDYLRQMSTSGSPFVPQSVMPSSTGLISGGSEANSSRPINIPMPGVPPTTGLSRYESSGAAQPPAKINDVPWHGKVNHSGQVEPIERPTSTLPFRHPKLAELLSDEAPRPPDSAPITDAVSSENPQSRAPQERMPFSSTRMMPETNSTTGFLPAASSRNSPTSYAKDNAPSYSYQGSRVDSATKFAQPSSSAVAYTSSNAAIPVSLPDRPYTNTHGFDSTAHPLYADASMRSNTPAMPPRPSSTRPTEGAWTSTMPPPHSFSHSSNRTRNSVRTYEPTGSTRSRASQSDTLAQKQSAAYYPSMASSVPPPDAPRPSLSEQESDRVIPSSSFQANSAKEAIQPSVLPPPRDTLHKLARVPSDESVLKTPSSLAPSVLKPTMSRTSIPASLSSQQESRKKGFLSIFRPKSSSQQQGQENSHEVWTPLPDDRYADREIPLKSGPANLPEKERTTLSSRTKVPPPITVPITISAGPERKSPNHKVFTPFRYLASKRNRTMSAASVEAVDGTAPNTVVGSPTASMHSSQPPIQPPPLRDAHLATQEWRERKEADLRNTRYRVQRPGVVFDVPQEPSEDKQNLKYVKSRGSRPSASSR